MPIGGLQIKSLIQNFLKERDVISESQWQIPTWVKNSAGWWSEEKISDDEFLNIIENLVKRKIIVI